MGISIKSQMKAKDFHMIVDIATERFKVFNAQGQLVHRGVITVHRDSPNKYPPPSKPPGQLFLASSKSGKVINTAALPTITSGVDVAILRSGKELTDEAIAKWAAGNGALFELGELDFDELYRYAGALTEHWPDRSANAQEVAKAQSPVVFLTMI